MNTIQHQCRIVENKKICPQFYRLSLDAQAIAKNIRPGQFIHIRIQDGHEPFFRRPFSVSRAQRYLEILYEVVGRGTMLLSQKKRGEELDVLGPLGTPFSLPTAAIKQIVMIAGGVGVAPFLMLSDCLKKTRHELILLYGGRTKGHVYDFKEFKQYGRKVHIATDDGSVGTKGRVSRLFSKVKTNPGTTFIYTCGPRPMMASVQKFAKRYNLRGEASCEETMACGLGACLGCSTPTTSGYKTVCYDGPVFDLQEVVL